MKYTKIYNAPKQALLCSLYLLFLFGGVLAAVVCVYMHLKYNKFTYCYIFKFQIICEFSRVH